MFTKRTIIGIITGAVIIGIGVAALVGSIGFQTLNIEETIESGKSLPYSIQASAGADQTMNITGERFVLSLASPGQGIQIDETQYEDKLELQWVHEQDGTTEIRIQNTGMDEVVIHAVLEVTTDPILFAYHFIVITAGVVIIGFSMGFSIRKPKGF